jgi:hypothetical protein
LTGGRRQHELHTERAIVRAPLGAKKARDRRSTVREPLIGTVVHCANSIKCRLMPSRSRTPLAKHSIECPPRGDGSFTCIALGREAAETDGQSRDPSDLCAGCILDLMLVVAMVYELEHILKSSFGQAG